MKHIFKKPTAIVTLLSLIGSQSVQAASFKVHMHGDNLEVMPGWQQQKDLIGKPTSEGFELKFDATSPHNVTEATVVYGMGNGHGNIIGTCDVTARSKNDLSNQIAWVQSSNAAGVICENMGPRDMKTSYSFASATLTGLGIGTLLGVGAVDLIMFNSMNNKKIEKIPIQIPIPMVELSTENKLSIMHFEHSLSQEQIKDIQHKAGHVWHNAYQIHQSIIKGQPGYAGALNTALQTAIDMYNMNVGSGTFNNKTPIILNDSIESAIFLSKLLHLEVETALADNVQYTHSDVLKLINFRMASDILDADLRELFEGNKVKHFLLSQIEAQLFGSLEKIPSDVKNVIIWKMLPRELLIKTSILFDYITNNTKEIDKNIRKHPLKPQFDVIGNNHDFIIKPQASQTPFWHKTGSQVAGFFSLILMGASLGATLWAIGRQAHSVSLDVKVRKLASPLPKTSLAHTTFTPAGGISRIIELGAQLFLVPNGHDVILASGKEEDKIIENPSHVIIEDVLPARALSTETCVNQKTGIVTAVTRTSEGLSIVHLNDQARLAGTRQTATKTLFAGQYIEDVKLAQDELGQKCSAYVKTIEKIKDTKGDVIDTKTHFYVSKEGAPTLSSLTNETSDFDELLYAASDRFGNLYFAMESKPNLLVVPMLDLQKDFLLSAAKDTGMNKDSIQNIFNLPNGHLMIKTKNKDWLYTTSDKNVIPVPYILVKNELGADNFNINDFDILEVVQVPSIESGKLESGEQSGTTVAMLRSSDPLGQRKDGQKKTGAILLNIPVGNKDDSFAGWTARSIHEKDYVVGYNSEISLLTTVPIVNVTTDNKVTEVEYSLLDLQNFVSTPIDDVTFVPEEGSGKFLYVTKSGELVKVEAESFEQIKIQNDKFKAQNIPRRRMLPLWDAQMIAMTSGQHGNELELLDKQGKSLSTFVFEEGANGDLYPIQINDFTSALDGKKNADEKEGEVILAATQSGIKILTQTATKNSKVTYDQDVFTLFEGLNFDRAYVDFSGHLVLMSEENFGKGGLVSTISFAEILKNKEAQKDGSWSESDNFDFVEGGE